MNPATVIAQGLWAAGNLVSAARFAAALHDPQQAQAAWLKKRLLEDANSSFGREHGFSTIRDARDFTRAVPLRDWNAFSPWIDRLRKGEKAVLSMAPVTHLAPTSGSSGARKLIPFTHTLHHAFAQAVGAWMTDLTRAEPGLLTGPAYWSISPLAAEDADETGALRVGFADDADYLGGWKARLARLVMAAPADLRHERDIDTFWRRTATCLLARRDLRLISVWHPSFLDLLLRSAEQNWNEILSTLPPGRAAELRCIGPRSPASWWPSLRVISCWGDLAAEPGLRALEAEFPRCRVQAKGLLATEAVVTIPWRGVYPLAICSHYFEFLSEQGDVIAAHELETGKAYEVIVTNGGGLWRYRLGDRVECTGHSQRTPLLRFLGRIGNVSDLCGEKLSELFIAQVFAAQWPHGKNRPLKAFLRPNQHPGQTGYDLVVDRPVDESCLAALEASLRQNPHYNLARQLGQLRELRSSVEPENPLTTPQNQRLGDIKPKVLEAIENKVGQRSTNISLTSRSSEESQT